MIERNQALVSYIWFCLELDDYDCTTCAPDGIRLTLEEWEEAYEISDTDKCPITTAFRDLFSILSTWDVRLDLILDISIYSVSNSEHCSHILPFCLTLLGICQVGMVLSRQDQAAIIMTLSMVGLLIFDTLLRLDVLLEKCSIQL